MELRLQPKPEVKILPADRGIVSWTQFFVKKKFEKINPYFFPALFIRDWKPKAELIYPPVSDETAIQYECDFNRNIQNCFVEDYAEEIFLRTPPPCFVVIGKCGKSIKKLSQELAKEYGSVLIQVDEVASQVLKRNTETSKVLDRLLRCGVSLTLNFILALLSYIAHTAEARHRGYVLCGLPCVPLSNDLSVDDQFNYLFTWENKPTVFINVLFDDEDLVKERTHLLCEIKGKKNEKYLLFHSEEFTNEEDESEEDGYDNLLPVKEETSFFERDINISPSRPWIKLPKDEEFQVWSELELYDKIIRPAIKLVQSRIDPQYFLAVDSRVKNELDVVLARLSLLQIWRAPVAVPFILPKEIKASINNETDDVEAEEESSSGSEYSFDVKQVVQDPPETAFLTLFSQKTISPKFRWELSHYNYICPVSLREGEVVKGKSEFAVIFLKYIYFLHDKECMLKFIQNPRAYVLPIRPKPPCRFIILGYPFTGKTSLAKALAAEYSIPLIDVHTVLKNDLKQKKYIYQEFCRQKAECLETIRLTSKAWQDWRMEEEQRLYLIEEWILYIEILLSRRIEQFYSTGLQENAGLDKDLSVKEIRVPFQMYDKSDEDVPKNGSAKSEGSKKLRNTKSLEVHGTTLDPEISEPRPSEPFAVESQTSPSTKIIQAMKHEDFNFNEKYLEVEANLFFSSLWKSFSDEDNNFSFRNLNKTDEEKEETCGELEEDEFGADEKSNMVSWVHLLPPQSLSSFLMKKKPVTSREKRQSFKTFLEAASKAYWEPCKLKAEFAKWRLPCYMDIPLCETFLDNPLLLLIYLPEWLKERPLIPDPVDPNHPSILEAGRKAFLRADVVTIKQSQEDIGILLRSAIEKVEREGMRVTGEVISPGGWVIDNMTLDLNVWDKLVYDQVFADHIYILVDTEPNYGRIINVWWDLIGRYSVLNESNLGSKEGAKMEEDVEELTAEKITKISVNDITFSTSNNTSIETNSFFENFVQLLLNNAKAIAEGDEELDNIYAILMDDTAKTKSYVPSFPVDSFCHNMLENTVETWQHLKEESGNEEALLTVQTFSNTPIYNMSNTSLFYAQQTCPFACSFPLGAQFEIFTSEFWNFFKKKSHEDNDDQEEINKKGLVDALEFFILLLTFPKKLEQLKEWLTSAAAKTAIHEIVMTGKTREEVFLEIKKNLSAPFIKKPRELEDFEIEEIKLSQSLTENRISGPETSKTEESEDIRIFGESGQLCIVNLERDILLQGKPEYALKYYGKLYYFWNQDAKEKFIKDPEKYAPYYSAIRSYPPLRVFVIGPVGCGKTIIRESIANQCSINSINYSTFVFKKLVPYLDPKSRKFIVVGDQKILLSEGQNAAAKLARENFMNAPDDKRQFWLENPFYLDFFDNEKFLKNLINITEPVTAISENFPELTYTNIDSILEEKLLEDDSSDISENKNASDVPETFYQSMKDIEIIINNYLENNGDLTDYCIEKSYKTLWNKEPFISQGFILEGFPLRSDDIKSLTENNWIPDVIIEIKLSEDVAIERNINSLMESWDTKLKQETVEEKSIQDALKTIQKVYMYYRRNELLKEKLNESIQEFQDRLKAEERNGNSQTSIQSEDIDDDDEIKINTNFGESPVKNLEIPGDIRTSKNSLNVFTLPQEMKAQVEAKVEQILKDEFPPLVFNPVFESYDAAKDRIRANLSKFYKRDASELDKIKSSLTDLEVLWLEVDGLKSTNEILTNLYIILDKMKKRSGHKGEFAFPMTMEMSDKLLKQGYYFLSKFGKWCPVQVYRMKNPIHMFRPLKAKGKITPIAYRNYIYFVGGENEKLKFIEDPIKYTFNEPHHPNVPLRVAVIGPPKSGKSTLCQRLGTMFDLKVVTMGAALRFALERTPESVLAKTIKNYLRRGCFLPLSLKVEALLLCLNDPSCAAQGFIFDGVPFDAALTQSLAEKGKLPFVIISLVADSYFGNVNRQGIDLNAFRLPYKNRTNLDSRYNDWNDTYKRFAQWNQDTYNNLYEVNAKLSVVDVFYQAYDIIRKSFFAILYYVDYCVSDRALPLRYLCVSQHEYELRKSLFHNNCPVCWVELNRLKSSSDPPPRSGLVQYLGKFYWVCCKHMERFLKKPKAYFPPNVQNWPKLLPKKVEMSAFENNSSNLKIHGLGRCPVTRTDFPSSLDWEGSREFAALYGNEIFLCKNQEMLDRFLAQPWKYCRADTQFEVNRPTKSNAVEQLGPLKIMSLPPIGFLEQTVADLIHECLQILGIVRPVYPNMSPTVTGCVFVALYLKVHNKKNKSSFLERQYLDFMLQCCRACCFQQISVELSQERLALGRGDFEHSVSSISSSSSEEERLDTDQYRQTMSDEKSLSLDPHFLEFQFLGEKIIWSAKHLSDKYDLMQLTVDDELIKIPEFPKTNVILKYQTYGLRSAPVPPISNCLNYIYSCKTSMHIPEKFDYRTLYQPPSSVSSPFTKTIMFNPEKQFALPLYSESEPSFPSKLNIHKTKRFVSDTSIDNASENAKTNVDPDLELLIERFVPRFQLYDKIISPKVPPVPKVIEEEPLVFNPQRDYAYTVLFSEFFRTTQVLKCYEWNESQRYLEYMNRLDKNLGLTSVRINYFFEPRITASLRSATSVDSYQRIFDAASLFYVRSQIQDSESSHKNLSEKPTAESSLINFFHILILQNLDQVLNRLSNSSLSYDNFEICPVSAESKESSKYDIVIQEVLPYPPLPWDVITRPYYAYSSIFFIFQTPRLDDIAHERHVSLLDGIIEPDGELRFVSYPVLALKKSKPCHQTRLLNERKSTKEPHRKQVHFYYDFFNLPWASFLIYPHSWAYNVDITHGFAEVNQSSESPCPQDLLLSNCNLEAQ